MTHEFYFFILFQAETAFVSPILLSIGIEHQHMTMVWGISPLIGFFLTPILGSLSDRCRLSWGRRRPIILTLSIGLLAGLILAPYGKTFGHWLGEGPLKVEENFSVDNFTETTTTLHISTTNPYENRSIHTESILNETITESVTSSISQVRNSTDAFQAIETTVKSVVRRSTRNHETSTNYYYWAIVLTIFGTVLLDFNADNIQSPARAYLLDMCLQEDHGKGLSMFSIMAGTGGSLGYALGAINWEETLFLNVVGDNIKTVFALVTIIFVLTVAYTLTSFREIPLELLEADEMLRPLTNAAMKKEREFRMKVIEHEARALMNGNRIDEESDSETEDVEKPVTLTQYLKSIVIMPNSMKILCLTNLFCWMSHLCYCLYFTDFVGEAVFHGSPDPSNQEDYKLYEEGVRFGCIGMSISAFTCMLYAMVIEKLIRKFKAKIVFIGGMMTYALGIGILGIWPTKWGVLVFSTTAGIVYATVFTIPFMLVANYHGKGSVRNIRYFYI